MKFVFDLDGTICFQGKPISDKILRTLAEVTKAGHEVIFASARPIRDMLPVIHKDFHHYTMIGGNGSLISKKGEIIYSKAFSNQERTDITNLINEYQATYLIDGDWNYAYTGPSDHPVRQNLDPAGLAELVSLEALPSIVKVLLLTSNDMKKLAKKLSKLDISVNKHGNEDVLDISPKGISKWSALEVLGVPKQGYVAFGNDANDIQMFENALYTVMIGYHERLSHFAKEMIMTEGDYEQKIIAKMKQLKNVLMPI